MKKNKGKKSYIVQQDNRIANEKDSFKRYERNVLYQAVRALQEKYPIKKLDDGTSIHAYNTNDIRSEIVTLTETRLLECLGSKNAGKRNHLPELKDKWFVFISKRDDGIYGKPYFCYIDRQGKAHKPFVLPQKELSFYDDCLKSFNIPELSRGPVPFNTIDIEQALKQEAEQFR